MANNGFLSDLVAGILQGEWHEKPFGHLRMHWAIKPATMPGFLRGIDEQETWRELPHPEAAGRRQYFDLENADSDILQWIDFQGAFDLLWESFLWEAWPHSMALPTKRPEELQVRVFQDLPGYFISPHCDELNKALTCFIALDSTEEGLSLGEEAEITIPRRAGSGYAFVPQEGQTWHSVGPIHVPRLSLALIFYWEKNK